MPINSNINKSWVLNLSHTFTLQYKISPMTFDLNKYKKQNNPAGVKSRAEQMTGALAETF